MKGRSIHRQGRWFISLCSRYIKAVQQYQVSQVETVVSWWYISDSVSKTLNRQLLLLSYWLCWLRWTPFSPLSSAHSAGLSSVWSAQFQWVIGCLEGWSAQAVTVVSRVSHSIPYSPLLSVSVPSPVRTAAISTGHLTLAAVISGYIHIFGQPSLFFFTAIGNNGLFYQHSHQHSQFRTFWLPCPILRNVTVPCLAGISAACTDEEAQLTSHAGAKK